MLDTLTKGFKAARNRLAGKAEITEAVVEEALRDIRVALLEADVSLDVVRRFVARVKDKAVGEIVQVKAKDEKGQKLKVTPQDHFIKVCHDELEALMGPVDTKLAYSAVNTRPTGIMMVGLQGSGKTTTVSKLAHHLIKQGKKPLLVAADIYRPAAVEQLQVLGDKLQVPVYHRPGVPPPQMCHDAIEEAHKQKRDVVIFDTAGRLAIDEDMMKELEEIKRVAKPENILLVCDAMIGQDAVKTAAEFNRRLDLSGFILTKLDGDARGGAALSIKEVTGKPIKFLGMGEGVDKLEEFRPEGLAGRILGFGDIVGLMKDFEGVVDEQKAEEDAEKILSGQFSFGDFVAQIKTVRKMGPIKELLEKFPIFGDMTDQLQVDDKEFVKIEAVHDSMTQQERTRSDLLNESRVNRIAKGCGHKPESVKEVVSRYLMMRNVMGKIGSAPGLLGMLPGFKQFAQLRQLKGQKMDDVFGEDAGAMQRAMVQQQMQAMGLPKGYTPPMGAVQRAKARAAGMSLDAGEVKSVTDHERDALKEKRKRERQNKKKARKQRR
ncbi:MAG TPA: signal recognition particle protein [Myxococcales bacterium]|jgi:signal recognition particle subunit SRP54